MRIEMGYNDKGKRGSICFEELSPDEFDNLRQILRSIFQFTQFQNCKELARQLDVTQLRTQLITDAVPTIPPEPTASACELSGGCESSK